MIEFRPAPASVPTGQRVYAVGDVHGCLDRLVAMHVAIAEDLHARPTGNAVLIHLGDYVDRGPDTAGVVALLAGGRVPTAIHSVVNLMGNHEEMLLSALATRSREAAGLWLMNGGAASLKSWDIPGSDLEGPDGPGSWGARIPEAHLAFLRGLGLMHRLGGYVFVHAGLCPGVPLARQSRHDLLWIREPFLSSPERFEAVVVHGHTPTAKPVMRANRIGIDTGAVMGGVLTCAVLEANRLGFLSR